MDSETWFEVIECLAGWYAHCQIKVCDDWKKYRAALESGMPVGFWRSVLRSDISDLRKARKVFKKF